MGFLRMCGGGGGVVLTFLVVCNVVVLYMHCLRYMVHFVSSMGCCIVHYTLVHKRTTFHSFVQFFFLITKKLYKLNSTHILD